jgi:hypothetical protein
MLCYVCWRAQHQHNLEKLVHIFEKFDEVRDFASLPMHALHAPSYKTHLPLRVGLDCAAISPPPPPIPHSRRMATEPCPLLSSLSS